MCIADCFYFSIFEDHPKLFCSEIFTHLNSLSLIKVIIFLICNLLIMFLNPQLISFLSIIRFLFLKMNADFSVFRLDRC